MKTPPLFIETKIKCDLETFRTHRQEPSRHHHWELLFPEIKYLQKDKGESTLVLTFSTDNKLSVIKQGSGYWKYIPESDGIKIIIAYDYQTHCVVPEKLHDAGYTFKYPTLETTFKNILTHEQ